MEEVKDKTEYFTRIRVVCITHGYEVPTAEEAFFFLQAESYQDVPCDLFVVEVPK